MLVLVAASGCRDQVFEPVRDGLVTSAVLSGEVNVTTKADLLFVIDDSASMAGEQEKLIAGFSQLQTALDALDPPVDWRVAVMTTSVDERFGPCDSAHPDSPAQCSADFGGSGFACEQNACVRRFPDLAGRLHAAPGNPAVLERAALSPADLLARFGANARPPATGSRQEQPLRALTTAFNNGGLAGFWRDDARLVVIVASDEDDCSDSRARVLAVEKTATGPVDRCDEQSRSGGQLLDSVGEWVKSFQALPVAGGRREVALAAFVGLAPGTQEPGVCVDPACAAVCSSPEHVNACAADCQGSLDPALCNSECRAQCEAFCGSQSPGRRLAQAVRLTGGPLFSICDSTFGPSLARLAAVVGIPDHIDLPSLPVDGRVLFFEVERGGQTIRCQEGADYSLDLVNMPPLLSIVPTGACRLLPGDRWTVKYLAR